MNLEEFVKFNSQKSHADIMDHSEQIGRMISPDMMVKFLTAFVLMKKVESSDSNEAIGLRYALNASSEFNMIDGHDQSISELVDKLVTEFNAPDLFKQSLINYANPTVKPFKDVSLVQYNHVKQIFTEKKVTDYVPGKNIKITLIDDLPENCTATTWVNNEYGKENFAKVAHLNTQTVIYKIRTDNKKADGELFVRVPFANFNFSVECI